MVVKSPEKRGDPCVQRSLQLLRPVSGVASDQRCFDPGRQEEGGGRATPKPGQGQDGARAAGSPSRVGEGLPPLPMGHAPAAARSRRASANPLLTYNQPIGNCQTAVRQILPPNNAIRFFGSLTFNQDFCRKYSLHLGTGPLDTTTHSVLGHIQSVNMTIPHVQLLAPSLPD